MRKLLLAAAAGLAFTTTTALAQDDDTPTAAQRAEVMKALTTAGCSGPQEIERDDRGFEVDDARCNDGKRYDLRLDAKYKITRRTVDD